MNKQRQMSNETAQLIDAEIKSIVEGGYVRAKEVLTENIDQLHALAKALLEYETLNGDEIKRVMAGEKIDRGPEDRRLAVPVGVSSIPKTGRAGGLGGAPAPQGACSGCHQDRKSGVWGKDGSGAVK